MSEAGVRNWLRTRAMRQAASVRAVFNAPGGGLSRDGEAVLADLREFCFAQKTTFHADAVETAKREGRRQVWLRLTQFLTLDEKQVQQLMEIDDGL
tara:strand:- start:4498 stop:4785 length:288 start_codon:yes stop_codon:yes gene_type:complete